MSDTPMQDHILRTNEERRRVIALNAACLSVLGLGDHTLNRPRDILDRAKQFERYLKGDDDA